VIERLFSCESTERDGDSAELGTSTPATTAVFTDFGATSIPHTAIISAHCPVTDIRQFTTIVI